ncbi:uncharacterized protein LOC128552733, partial [Mercenaria mercenaria]|uniref:uncharacterized protein LOC128552733 n=1 Tax=Mercenaria mercenaria TaxID=6596 RepID=UPI00234EE636
GLECLTGLPPHNPDDRDGDLRVQHIEKLRDKIQDIWLARDDIGPDAETVLQLCIQCIASPSKKNISSAEICQKLQVLLQHQRIYSWDRKNKLEHKCEICLINPAVADDVLTHKANCLCNIAVCIACIRNSYVNNIKCHSCDADIFPTIGHFWAALLIIGNDVKDSEVARVFKKDIMEVYRLIVSMCPRIMGIRPENVFVVEAKSPGQKGDLKSKLESAVEQMSKTDKTQTVLVYYSGHSDKNGLDLENDQVYVTGNEFSTYMKRIVTSRNTATDSIEFKNAVSPAVSPKRFICFLDCCHPPNLTSLHDPCVCVIQVNACRSQRQSMVEANGSVFTKFFIQALTQSAHGKECIDDQCDCTPIKGNFITVEQLVEYMRYHMKRYQRKRNIETYNAPEKHEMHVTSHDEKIAYNIDFLVQLEFRFKDPDSGGDMIKKRIKPHFISDMQGLSRILFATFIEKKFPALSFDETDLNVYQDCICVEIDKGPKETEELDTIEKVMKAWNARRDLAVSLRRLSSIKRGMVLLNLHPVKIQQFLENICIASLKVCSVPSNFSFTIPFADIPELKRKIGRKPGGELKVFRDHLSDIMNACRLEENEDALFAIILPNPEDKRKLPFVCYKMTIIKKLQQEGPTGIGRSIDTENEGVAETVPKQVYNTSTTPPRYETSTNNEMNTHSGNKNTTDRGVVQQSVGKGNYISSNYL